MECRVTDMCYKEVINVCDGQRLGFVCDVEVDVVSGRVISLIVPGPYRFWGIFGREDDFVIPWECISRIGEDIIIIEVRGEYGRGRRNRKGWI